MLHILDAAWEAAGRALQFTQISLAAAIVKTGRISRLLLFGYSSGHSRRKYERSHNWVHFHGTILKKIENILIVSGLLLASNTNLLCAAPMRRMTYATVMGSMFLSFLSITCGMLCLWSITGVDPSRLENLLKGNYLFYYLFATPSLFGGASALAFFVAVGSWSWMDGDHGWGSRIVSVVIGGMLILNAALCFVLGGSNWEDAATNVDPQSAASGNFTPTGVPEPT